MCAMKGTNNVTIGYDEGSIMVKVILVSLELFAADFLILNLPER